MDDYLGEYLQKILNVHPVIFIVKIEYSYGKKFKQIMLNINKLTELVLVVAYSVSHSQPELSHFSRSFWLVSSLASNFV